MEKTSMNAEANEVAEEVAEEKVDPNLANREAFDAAVAADQSEDDVKMAMINAGASFKNVTRLYNQYMVDAGFAVSKEEKTEIVTKILAKAKGLDTEDGFKKVVGLIVEKANGVTEKSAAALIRTWAKGQEVAEGEEALEIWKKPKGTGAGRSGFKAKFYAALVANPAMTKDECHEYLKTAEGTSANIQKRETVYQAIREMANTISAAKAA
jgi:uncharacterized protein (DUF697 family)